MLTCPLCICSVGSRVVPGPGAVVYHLCENCYLVFASTGNHPTKEEEEERYLQHNNGIQYEGYVNFLHRAITPALEFLKPEGHGLDFGCGPTPTLSLLLKQMGYSCDDYDPIFFPELNLNKPYDFIFSTECFEHFFYPAKELEKIKSLLAEDGILVIMTELWDSLEKFRSWHYAKDHTHVSFYHQRTINYIAETYGMRILFNDNVRVVILQKQVQV